MPHKGLAHRRPRLQRAAPELWANPAVLGRKLTPVPIGRDVIIDVAAFDMVGRKYRNLRQAVQRTTNFGITTEWLTNRACPTICLPS